MFPIGPAFLGFSAKSSRIGWRGPAGVSDLCHGRHPLRGVLEREGAHRDNRRNSPTSRNLSKIPDHWQTLLGPANWFQVSYPPHWSSGERRGTFTLSPTGSDAVLAINSLWLGGEGGSPATRTPSVEQIAEQFPHSRNVHRHPPRPDLGLVECLTGEAVLDPPPPWYKRWLARKQWRRWKVWAFHNGPLFVIVSLIHPLERDPDLDGLAEMIVSTLRLGEVPAPPPEEFASRALTLAQRKFPLLECRLGEDFQLHVGESTVNLFNFYRTFVKTPDRFEEIMLPALTTVVQVQEWGQEQTEPIFDDVQERIMPMLYPETVWKEKFPDFVCTTWVGGLVILYVVDEAQAYWYIRKELLTHWTLDPEDLHEIAIKNLENYFDRQPMELAVAGAEDSGPRMLMPSRADSYNCARFLSESFLHKLRRVIGGDLAVGLPGRDFFVALSLDSSTMVEQVRKKVHEDFEQMDHPLTDRMLLVTPDGVSELVMEET